MCDIKINERNLYNNVSCPWLVFHVLKYLYIQLKFLYGSSEPRWFGGTSDLQSNSKCLLPVEYPLKRLEDIVIKRNKNIDSGFKIFPSCQSVHKTIGQSKMQVFHNLFQMGSLYTIGKSGVTTWSIVTFSNSLTKKTPKRWIEDSLSDIL